jgi:hypothetical protein
MLVAGEAYTSAPILRPGSNIGLLPSEILWVYSATFSPLPKSNPNPVNATLILLCATANDDASIMAHNAANNLIFVILLVLF